MRKKLDKVDEIKFNSKQVKFNCYRVLYEDGKFNIYFGNFDQDNNTVKVNTDINFSEEEFKDFFEVILYSIIDFEHKTGKKFLKIKEDDLNG